MSKGDTFIGGITVGGDDFECEVCGHKYHASFTRHFGVPNYEGVRCPNCQILGRGKSKRDREREKEWDELLEHIKDHAKRRAE